MKLQAAQSPSMTHKDYSELLRVKMKNTYLEMRTAGHF